VFVIGSVPYVAYCAFHEHLSYKRMRPEVLQLKLAEARVLLGFIGLRPCAADPS
jgi:hypothetical protein